MNTKAKSNSVITYAYDAETNAITYTVLGVGDLVLNLDQVSVKNRDYAAVHGFGQRIPDAAAIPRDTETGKSATPQEKFDAMAKLVTHYNSGTSEWSRVREAGEGNSGGLLLAALTQLSPTKSKDEIRSWMKSQTRTQLNALREKDSVKKVIDSLRPTPSISVDTDAMLAEIGI